MTSFNGSENTLGRIRSNTKDATLAIMQSILLKEDQMRKKTKLHFLHTYSILQYAFIEAYFELICLLGCSMLLLILYLFFHVDSHKND